MNQDEFPLYPPIKKTINICKFTYSMLELKLFESVRVLVYLIDDTDIIRESRHYDISGDGYKAWSKDDQYIVNLIKMKLQQPYIL
jgi:hypothetical protein